MLLTSASRTGHVFATASRLGSRFSSSLAKAAVGGLFERSYRGSIRANTIASNPLSTLSTRTRCFSSSDLLRLNKEPGSASLLRKRVLEAESKKAEGVAKKAAEAAQMAKEDRERKKAKDEERKKFLQFSCYILALLLLDWVWHSSRWMQRFKIMFWMWWGPTEGALPPVPKPKDPLLELNDLRINLNDPRPLWLLG
jgi:hypothetical protein